MAKKKGVGTVVQTDLFGAGLVTVGCSFDITPPGISYALSQDEQCLDELGVASVSLGDEDPDEIVFTHAFEPGGLETEALIGWAKNQTIATWRLKFPFESDPLEFSGPIRVFKPEAIARNEFMKVPVTILRTTQFVNVASGFGIEYDDPAYTFTKDQAIATETPTLTGTPTNIASSPTLPDGLSLNPTTGAITGTPTTTQEFQDYAITAVDATNSDTATIRIKIVA